jgi:SAM-dependent MidA family methyltransferase
VSVPVPSANSVPHPAPEWLARRLLAAGGAVPFRTYMEWVLHDPEYGFYGSGRLRIGPRGDFATAPSLGPEFAALLAPQIAQWLEDLAAGLPRAAPMEAAAVPVAVPDGAGRRPLALVETGPGEGDLAAQLAAALAEHWPALAAQTELVLVEPNGGMAERQRQRLADCVLPVRWSTFAELAAAPLTAVVLAHEVLDALAVERIEWDGAQWRRQMVTLRGECLQLEAGEPLEPPVKALLEPLGLLADCRQRPPGWCTELHPGVEPWLAAAAAALQRGRLLLIDYALEARRFYSLRRSTGTLMAYRAQWASGDPLLDPGHWDLTAHLCLESLRWAAEAGGWRWLGVRRQGESLLALGLAERLHGLQRGSPAELADLLQRRESLLRLVDPTGLGDFRWVALARGEHSRAPDLFLGDGPVRS